MRATSGTIKVGKGANLFVSALDMQDATVNGNFNITGIAETGNITLKKMLPCMLAHYR